MASSLPRPAHLTVSASCSPAVGTRGAREVRAVAKSTSKGRARRVGGESSSWGPSPLMLVGAPCPGPLKPGCRQSGFSLWYQRYDHLGLQVFLGLTLTHIYTEEVLFCMPSNFPIRVLFFLKGKILILNLVLLTDFMVS